MKNRSTGRLGHLFLKAVTLEGRCPGSVVTNKESGRDPGLRHSRMTLCDNGKATACGAGLFCKGFTLIELLVVVLIIGILAAIALPQYRVAVGKAQMMKMAPIARAIYEAAKRCELETGSSASCANFENLDVQLPGAATYTPYDNGFQARFSSCFCVLKPGPYVQCGATGGETFSHPDYVISGGDAYCLASNWGEYDENKGSHKICKSLGGVKTSSNWNDAAHTSSNAFYKLP